MRHTSFTRAFWEAPKVRYLNLGFRPERYILCPCSESRAEIKDWPLVYQDDPISIKCEPIKVLLLQHTIKYRLRGKRFGSYLHTLVWFAGTCPRCKVLYVGEWSSDTGHTKYWELFKNVDDHPVPMSSHFDP